MDCYGKKYGKLEKCKTCELDVYCSDAKDIPLLSKISLNEERACKYMVTAPAVFDSESETPQEEPRFTFTQLCDAIKAVLDFDDEAERVILKHKISNPDISLSSIGRLYGVTKQAIYKRIRASCSKYPFLMPILRNRPLYNRWRKTNYADIKIPVRRRNFAKMTQGIAKYKKQNIRGEDV